MIPIIKIGPPDRKRTIARYRYDHTRNNNSQRRPDF